MTVFAQAFFALMRCHFMTFAFFSARHSVVLERCEKKVVYEPASSGNELIIWRALWAISVPGAAAIHFSNHSFED